jgi:predicted GIY-YIG superfamily endonuclease
MRDIASANALPNVPAVYLMCGGQGRGQYVAYVGVAERLKQRAWQHLVGRNSSVTTGVAAVSLNPSLVTELRWWEHPKFVERAAREAAELVAFDVFEPILRSRGAIMAAANDLYAEQQFRSEMTALFTTDATGRLMIPTLQDALERIATLERRVEALERQAQPSKEARGSADG